MTRMLVLIALALAFWFALSDVLTPAVLADGPTAPPTITGFQVTEGAIQGSCIITGVVTNTDPSNTTVVLKGVIGTYTLPVKSDGTFSWSGIVSTSGTVGAQAVTSSGQTSNIVSDYVL